MTLRTYTLLLCIFWAGTSSAQKTLIGLTRGEQGHVIEYNLNSEELNTPSVTTGDALPWYNDLIQAKDGKLYGMTESGGKNGRGTIFSYDPTSNEVVVLYDDFGKDEFHPASPFGSLTQLKLTAEKEDFLYGMTESGGELGYGTIFSFNIKTKSLTTLHHFNKANGRSPYGSLLEATNGKLYGVTESGGVNDFGTIFSFDPNEIDETKKFTLLHSFKQTDGRSPYGSLVEYNNELYGVAQFGGTYIYNDDEPKTIFSYGVVFSIKFDGTSFSKRADFDWTNGAWPNSTLVLVGNKLYGTAESGGPNITSEHSGLSSFGVIYLFDPVENKIESLFEFSGNEAEENGRTPYGKLTLASDGLLYGMTFRGGTEDKGVLFAFNTSGFVYDKKLDFTGANGMNPAASLIEVNIPNNPLPLTLVSFSASNESNKVQLYWDVEQEFDISHYEVERSTDGIRFTTIGTVTAVNSQSSHQYNFADLQPAGGKNFYRLKITERYKPPHYSYIKVISRGKAAFGVTVQPNPVTANSTVHISLQARSKVQIALYNVQGMRLKQWTATTLDKGEHDVPLQLADVPSGSYILVVEAGKNKQALQLIKGSKN